MVSGHVPNSVSGTAVWHELGEEPANLLGLAYPALDPETSCEHAASAPSACSGDLHGVEEHAVDPHATGAGCVRLPYLSVGSLIKLRNDCAERTRVVPVTSCGATARLFCDRCVTCGTSRKGRIADLTMAAFVELGGALEVGCFNAARLLRAVRTAAPPGRADYRRLAHELGVAQVRGPDCRRGTVRRLAGRLLALRGVSRSGARSPGRHRLRCLPSVPQAGHPSGGPRRRHRRGPRARRDPRVCRYLGNSTEFLRETDNPVGRRRASA
jgi:hypothetical protein